MHPSVPAFAAALLAFYGTAVAAPPDEPWGQGSKWMRVSFRDVNGFPHDLFRNDALPEPLRLYQLVAVGDQWQAHLSPYAFLLQGDNGAAAVAKVQYPDSERGIKYQAPQVAKAFDPKMDVTTAWWGKRTVRRPDGPQQLAEPTPFRMLAGPPPKINPAGPRRDKDKFTSDVPAPVRFARKFEPIELLLGYGELDPNFKILDKADEAIASITVLGDSQHNAELNTAINFRRDQAVDLAKRLLEKVGGKENCKDCFSSGEDILLLRLVEFVPVPDNDPRTPEKRLADFYANLQLQVKAKQLEPFVNAQRAFMKGILEKYVKSPKPKLTSVTATGPAVKPDKGVTAPQFRPKRVPGLTKAQPQKRPIVGDVPSPLQPEEALTPAELEELKAFHRGSK